MGRVIGQQGDITVTPLAISGLIFVCVGSSVFIGMLVARALPEHHLHPDSKDTVKQGLALIATLSGLVIALLVAATKGAYDANTAAVQSWRPMLNSSTASSPCTAPRRRKLASGCAILPPCTIAFGPRTAARRPI